MPDSGEDSAGEVKEKITNVAEFVFDEIAEYPEKEHISRDMPEPAVEEHAGDELPEMRLGVVPDTRRIHAFEGRRDARPEFERSFNPDFHFVGK